MGDSRVFPNTGLPDSCKRQDTHPIFSSVFLSFKETFPQHCVDEFQEIKSLGDLNHAIQEIEKQQANRRCLRNMQKIRPFLNALEQYSQVIEVFVNAKPDMLAFIWGPIKFCLQIASRFARAFDSLLNAYSKLSDALPNISAIEQLFGQHEHVKVVLADIYKDILTFHDRATKFFSRKGWKIALTLTCRTFDDMFDDLLSNLERSKQLLLTSADIAHFREAQEARFKFQNYIREDQKKAWIEHKYSIQSWLKPHLHVHQHHDLQQVRQQYPQTTKWIFQELAWKDWLRTSRDTAHVLWLSGIPGAGKTVLFSAMVDEIGGTISDRVETGLVYLYCKYKDQNRDNFTEITKSLIDQLLGENESCLEYLYDTILGEDSEHATTKTGLRRIIQALIQCYDLVFIGIDGLDECEQSERSALLSLVENLVHQPEAEISVKVFLTSRKEIDIERSLGSSTRIDIKSQNLFADIQVYVNTRAVELHRFELTSEIIQKITERLVVQSAGMFLLARLMLDVFKLCINKEDLEEELSNDMLPKGIDEAYGRILARVTKRDTETGRPRVRQLLEILSCARRTLRIHEIQGMLSVRTDKKNIDFNNRRYLEHFKELCGPLVDVHSDETLELVHATAKRYLEDPRWGYVDQRIAKYRMAQLCTTYLTLDCFTKISCDKNLVAAAQRGDYAFQDYAVCNWYYHVQALKDSDNNNLINTEDLLLPVREVLTLHYQNLEVISNLINDLNQKKKSISLCWAAMTELSRAYSELESIDDSSETGPHLPEIFVQLSRIRGFIEILLDQPADDQQLYLRKAAYGSHPYKCPFLSCQRFYQGFPSRRERDLHRRSHDRHFKCVAGECQFKTIGFPTKAALNAHVNFFHITSLTNQFSNLKIRSIWQTLIDAIDNNESSLIEDLCRDETSFLVIDSRLVLRAIKKSNVETVKALLAQLGSTKIVDRHILTYATVRGDAEVLQLLVQNFGVAKIDTRLSMKLLIKAAEKGYAEVVRVILGLRHTYERNQLRPSLSPLYSAAAAGHDEVVSLILEHPLAHYSASCFDTAVRAAVANGAKSTVELLLERGIYNEEWARQSRVLKKVSEMGPGVSVTSLSKDFAPIVDSKGKAFGSGFHKAALANDIEKIKRYLQHGADIDQVNTGSGTALQSAARKDCVAAVRFLLDQGAKLTVEGGKYGNALAAAAAKNHIEMVRMLLATGCNPSMKTSRRMHAYLGDGYQDCAGFTPLHWAAYGKHKEIVQILLAAKADIQATTYTGQSPLHVVFFSKRIFDKKAPKSQVPVIQLLLEHGADAKAKDKLGDTPLHMAVYRTKHLLRVDAGEVIRAAKILIENGANFDEKNLKGDTPRKIASAAGNEILDALTSIARVESRSHTSPVTLAAGTQPSQDESGTKAAEVPSFDQNVMLKTSDSPNAQVPSPALEPRTASLNVYSKSETSPTFTVMPSEAERPGSLEMDDSLFINPWADEDQQLETTVQQPDPVWNPRNCHFCARADPENFRFCSDCGIFQDLCRVCWESTAGDGSRCDDCFRAIFVVENDP